MLRFLVFTALLAIGWCDLNHKINLGCDEPSTPQYLPDHGYGSYCRFDAAYSVLDIVFAVEVSEFTDTGLLGQVVKTCVFILNK